MKKIPYGKTDYKKLIDDNCYYVDKTKFLEKLENNNDTIIYLRPRRFGKTLFTSMMYYYYDINSKEDYDYLFKDTYIYKHPTKSRNSYYILRFDFSGISSGDSEKQLEETFNEYVENSFQNFIDRYNLKIDLGNNKKASLVVDTFFSKLGKTYPVYVIIDEYDNFTNNLLKEDAKILGKDGFIRDFYAILKKWNGIIIGKMFITGVCSISLDSMTSVFNIGTNITNNINYNSMTALTYNEVKELVNYLNITENIFDIMEENYDGYKFNADIKEKVFNPNLVMYFLSEYLENKKVPLNLLDKNIYSDYNQIKNIVYLFDTNLYKDTINEILENKNIMGALQENLFLEGHRNDKNYIISLLYYFGYLTMGNRVLGSNTNIFFNIPNKVMESIFVSYFINILKSASIIIDTTKSTEIGLDLNEGNIDKLNKYSSKIIELCDNRIFNNFNERSIQLIYFTVMQDVSFYSTYNEFQTNGGYADLMLLGKVKEAKYDFIIEFKYIKKEDYSENLLNKKINEAKKQLIRYSNDPRLRNNIKKYVILYVGRKLTKTLEIQ